MSAEKVERPLYIRFDATTNSLVAYLRNKSDFQLRQNLHTQLREGTLWRRYDTGSGKVKIASSLWWGNQVRTTLTFAQLNGRPNDMDLLRSQQELHILRNVLRCHYIAEGTAVVHTQLDPDERPVAHTVTIRHCGNPTMAVAQTRLSLLEQAGIAPTMVDGVLTLSIAGTATQEEICQQTILGAKALSVFLPTRPVETLSYR